MNTVTLIPALLAQQAPAQGGGFIVSLLPIILICAAMWFLLIAPQRKQQKEHQKMITALAAGDEVLTSGGIYGVISSVKDDRFVIRIGDNIKVEVGKGFIQSVGKKAA